MSTKLFIFSRDFNKVYHSAGDDFTSAVIEANSEQEAREILSKSEDYFETYGDNWQVKEVKEIMTGMPHMILLTYGMY